jgi:ferredoxin, 2Fe-2S
MVRVTFIDNDKPITLDAPAGHSLMKSAVHKGVAGIEAVCGGACSCATCHVYVHEEWLSKLPEKSKDEAEMLEFVAGVEANSRLSCQIELNDELDGLVVTVPVSQF